MPDDLSDIECFISYHRPDNADYLDVVERLRREIEGRFSATTGRQLRIFLDKESIGWGQTWRERIFDSILTTTLFIPIVTMRFFRSEMCREELTAYHETAKRLGVTDLLLPVVLAGSEQIKASHPNPDVRLIESLNYISIEEAWEAGYESPQWRAIVNRMVREIAAALQRAEVVLVEREVQEELVPEERSAIRADVGSLVEEISATTELMTATTTAMGALGVSLTTATEAVSQASTQSRKAVELRVSRDIAAHSSAFASEAERFEVSATRTDAQLRAVVRELQDIDTQAANGLLDRLRGGFVNYPDMNAHVASIDEAIAGLRVAAMTSLSMRKALEPAMRALQSLRIGFSVAQSWPELLR